MREQKPKRRVERHVSAGGVVYRIIDGEIEAVLCGRSDPLRWSLPKGTPDKGESLEETALREVREETGLEVVIEAALGNISYWFVTPDNKANCNKTVHFFLMGQVGGYTGQHDPEFDEVRWFPSRQALKSLAFANEANVLKRALDVINNRVSS